jgi:hypothetical protein
MNLQLDLFRSPDLEVLSCPKQGIRVREESGAGTEEDGEDQLSRSFNVGICLPRFF